MSIQVLARPSAAAGFELAGLPIIEVAGPAEAALRLPLEIERTDVDILLVEQDLLDSLDEASRRALSVRSRPLIVGFPGPAWERETQPVESPLLDLLRRAIGYRVRLG